MFFRNYDGDIIDYYDKCMNCYSEELLQCNKCNEIKEKKCFSKDSTKKIGYRKICKVCTNKQNTAI